MEVRNYEHIDGVVVNEDIVEGRMAFKTTNQPGTYDFGSRGDLPGVTLPNDSTEAAQAKFLIGFAVDNRGLPIYQPTPAFDYALRTGGWDQAENVPFSATVHLTHPGNKIGQTIPSGELALAYFRGVFTVESGAYVYNAALQTPGALMDVANAADDGASEAGKLKYSASGVIAMVEQYNSDTGALTVRLL